MRNLREFPQLTKADAALVRRGVREVVERDEDALRQAPWFPRDEGSAITGGRIPSRWTPLVAGWHDDLRAQQGSRAVWMDTTSLYRARRLMDGEPEAGRGVFDALTLLDLDAFVRNFLLYDQIVFLRNDPATDWGDMRPLNESMQNVVFVPLLSDGQLGPEVNALFDSLHRDARGWVSAASASSSQPVMARQFTAWRSGTQKIYGTVPGSGTHIHLAQHWGSMADYVARLLMTPDRAPDSVMWAADEEYREQLIADATLRGVFNVELSRAIGLSYSPAAARLPTVAAFDVARAFTVIEALTIEAKSLWRERLEEATPYHGEVIAAPPWAAILLGRCRTAADVWPELVALRQQTAGLRARRAAWDKQLNGPREEKLLAELRQAMRTESSRLVTAWGGTSAFIGLGVVGSGLTGGAWGMSWMCGIAALLGAELFSDHPQKLRARLLRPRQALVTHLGSQVRGLRSTIPIAQRLWKLDDEQVDQYRAAYSRMTRMGWL